MEQEEIDRLWDLWSRWANDDVMWLQSQICWNADTDSNRVMYELPNLLLALEEAQHDSDWKKAVLRWFEINAPKP